MWGREMRAGLVFVLVSLLAGGAFREWRASHESRFADLVSILESTNEQPGPARLPVGLAHPNSTAVPGAAGAAAAKSPSALLRPAFLEVDRATAADFERLPGIGPSLAARIVADRERRGPYHTPEGLDRVPGIGPKILDRIRPFFATPPPAADSVSPNAN